MSNLDQLNFFPNERIDYPDFVKLSDQTLTSIKEDVVCFAIGKENADNDKNYVLDGFDLSIVSVTPPALHTQLQLDLGQAIDSNGQIISCGTASKYIDFLGKAQGLVYTIEISFNLIQTNYDNKSFWDVAITNEAIKKVATVGQADWTVRVITGTVGSGGIWIKIAEVDWNGDILPEHVVTKKQLYWEGEENSGTDVVIPTFSQTSENRADDGIHGEREFHMAVLKVFEQLKGASNNQIIVNTSQITASNVTGINSTNSTDYRLYGKIYLSGPDYTVELYKESARTNKVAHGSSLLSTGIITLVEDNSSGIGGNVTIAYSGTQNTWSIKIDNKWYHALAADETLYALRYKDITIDGNKVFNGDLTLNGEIEFNNTTQFDSSNVFNGSCEFNSTTQFDDSNVFNGSCEFNGTTQFDNSNVFNGDVTCNIGTVLFNEGISVLDGKSISGDVIFPSDIIFDTTGTVLFRNGMSVTDGKSISGDVIFPGDIIFDTTGTVLFRNGMTVTNGKSIAGNIVFPGNLDIQSYLFNSVSGQPVLVSDGLAITGVVDARNSIVNTTSGFEVWVNDDLRVEGGILLGGSLRCTGSPLIIDDYVRITGQLDIQGSIYNSLTGASVWIDDKCIISDNLDIRGNIFHNGSDPVTIDDNLVVTGTLDVSHKFSLSANSDCWIKGTRACWPYGLNNGVFIGDISESINTFTYGSFVLMNPSSVIDIYNSSGGTHNYHLGVRVMAEQGTWGCSYWNSAQGIIMPDPGLSGANLFVTINFKNQLMNTGTFAPQPDGIKVLGWGPADAFAGTNATVTFVSVINVSSTGAVIALLLSDDGGYPSGIGIDHPFYVYGTYQVHA